MADKKISELTGVTTLPETSLLTAVDLLRAANDQNVKIPLSDFIALVASDPTLNNPVENTYLDVASMIADQANQTINFFEYVSGTDEYYEFLDLGNVTIDDYRLLSDQEVLTVTGNNGYKTFRLQVIQDDTTPLTTISNGRIGFEYNIGTDAVTGVFFNSAYTDIIQTYVDLVGSVSYYIKIYNRDERRYDIAKVTGFATVNTDFTLASIENTIDRTNFSVQDRLEVNFDIDVEGGIGSTYNVDVLDFINDETTKQKVIDKDNTQDTTIVTAAVNAAVAFCLANQMKELHFSNGLYIINSVTINGIDDFVLVGHGSKIQYLSGNSIFNFVACENVFISGFHFTSTENSYSDVAFIRATNNNSYLKIFANKFENFPRCGILINDLLGGTYSEGAVIYLNEFIDSPNYSNVNQCGVELGDDGEYSKIINNNFYNIPSAARFTDGANSIFAYNNCLQINGDAYDANYDRGIIYSEPSGNSGKLDVVYNKINHNDTGIIAVLVKGDPTKPQNSVKIIGNDILIHGSPTEAVAIYLEECPTSIIKNNKFRGYITAPNDNCIVLDKSDNCQITGNYINSFNNGISLIESAGVSIIENVFELITVDDFIYDFDSSDIYFVKIGSQLIALDTGLTVTNDDLNKTFYNYTDTTRVITLDYTTLIDDFAFKIDAISADVTIAEASNIFLPSGDKTISAGDFAEVYKLGKSEKFRFTINTGVGGVVSPPVNNDGSAELAAIIARADTEVFTKPSAPTQTALQTFISNLLNDNIWNDIDLFLLFSYNDVAAENFSRINIKNPSSNLASFISPIYTVNGFKGNGGGIGYIDTNFNLVTDAVNYQQDSASRIGVLYEAPTAGATNRFDGQATGDQNFMFITNTTQNRINSTNTTTNVNMNGTGLKAYSRVDANNIVCHNQGVAENRASVSTGVDAENMWILNHDGNEGDAGIGLYILGGDLSGKMSLLRGHYGTYLSAIGLTEFQ